MKHSQVVGFLLALVVLGSCFFPWVIIESKQLTISGFHTKGTNFGRPGLFIFFTAGLALLFFLINKIWAKRLNVFVTTFCFAWSVSKYLMLSACYAGECPEKQIALYVLVFASAIMMVMSFLPKIKITEN
jgi:hypothetical protein